MVRFCKDSLNGLYDELADRDPLLKNILVQFGYPPVWIRPNSFETLVLTILEQQVSLASAYAAYKKLKEKIVITPENLLGLSDDELRSCYFSRQKTVYVRGLAQSILDKSLDLAALDQLPDEDVRRALKKLKGFGDWTVDIYLIHALRRTDVFPTGDLALVNSIKMARQEPGITKASLAGLSAQWRPYRSLATMLFWHYYIRTKDITLPAA